MNKNRPLTSHHLIDLGYKKHSTEILPNTQTMQTSYTKGTREVRYNGCDWTMVKWPESFSFTPENGLKITPIKIKYIEDLK